MYQNTRITPWFSVLHRVSYLRDAKAKDVADELGISHSHAVVAFNGDQLYAATGGVIAFLENPKSMVTLRP
jgi:hypothetical protein